MTTKFSLGLLSQFSPPAWHAATGRLSGGDWWTGRHFVDLAQRLEAAGFDYLFFLDTLAVRRDADDELDAEALRYAVTAPSHDPLPLLSMVAAATERIGIVGTASTSFYQPYTVARLFSTLDSISGGRIGWNIVNSFEESEARNFSASGLAAHGDRYARADEYVDVARKLWSAWDADALRRDEATDTYVDPAAVHSVDHVGEHFSVRGPLNVLRSPQTTPLLVQAGASDRGRDFAARNAELTFVPTDNGEVARLRAARDDIRSRAALAGRDPDRIQVVFPANVFFTEEPWDRSQGVPASEFQLRAATVWLSQSLDLDLTRFDLDEPFPLDVPPSGIRSMFDGIRDMAREGKTLREAILATRYSAGDLDFFGTPEQVAEKMVRFMDAVGGDGIMINGTMQFTDEALDLVTERLVPALRDAGALAEPSPAGSTLRQRLFGAGASDFA